MMFFTEKLFKKITLLVFLLNIFFIPVEAKAEDVRGVSCRCTVLWVGTTDTNDSGNKDNHCTNAFTAAGRGIQKNIPLVNRATSMTELYQLSQSQDLLTYSNDSGCRPFPRREDIDTVLRFNQGRIPYLNNERVTIVQDNCSSFGAMDTVSFGNGFYLFGFAQCSPGTKLVDSDINPILVSDNEKKVNDTGSVSDLKKLYPSLNMLSVKSVPELIGSGLKILMGITGSIALAIVIYAGILWMTAAGNAQREKQAMDILTWGALGLIVILSSYAIVQFIFTSVL